MIVQSVQCGSREKYPAILINNFNSGTKMFVITKSSSVVRKWLYMSM